MSHLTLVPPPGRAHNYLKHVLTGKILLLYPGKSITLPFGVDSDWAADKPVPGRSFRLVGETPAMYSARTGAKPEAIVSPPVIKSPSTRPRRPVEFF